MTSKIEVQKICQHCGKEFTARTTVTRFCSHRCAGAEYKQMVRAGKVEQSNKQTQQIKLKPFDELKTKEFLTVREVSLLLNCSVRSVYYYIENGTIKAVNLGQRITRVKRSQIDMIFEQPRPVTPQPEQIQFEISDCYNITEIQEKFGISQTGLQQIIKRNETPKIKKGKFVYIPKTVIDELLS